MKTIYTWEGLAMVCNCVITRLEYNLCKMANVVCFQIWQIYSTCFIYIFLYIASHIQYKHGFLRFKAVAAKSKLDLVNQGFTEFTIEDFHNTVSRNKKNLPAYCCCTLSFLTCVIVDFISSWTWLSCVKSSQPSGSCWALLMTRVCQTMWWFTCGCSPPAICKEKMASSSTS